ncbi:MAG: hypothetical protein EOP05_16365, partial [Proteobacteria bacterium]
MPEALAVIIERVKSAATSRPVRRREAHFSDRIFYYILKAMAWSTILVVLSIIGLLLKMAWPALTQFGWRFFIGND